MANILSRRDPDVPDLRRDIDRFFEEFLPRGLFRTALVEFTPSVDLIERDEDYLLRAELPGLRADDIDISVRDNVLTLRGEKRQEAEQDLRGYHYSERRYGAFARTIQLPGGVDSEKVQASYIDGVLEITLPKSEAAKPRRVHIEGQREASGNMGEHRVITQDAEQNKAPEQKKRPEQSK